MANVCSILHHIRRDGAFEGTLKVRWATRSSFRPQQIVDVEHLRMTSEKDWVLASRMIDELLTAEKHDEMRLRGDWYDLMMTLSEGDFDLVDSLFTALGKGKRHGAAHVLLSKLVGALGVNLFLTLNFDPFLESAFIAEGHNPKVVDTSRDADLPSPLVVSDELSIVKLHGSAYGLRIGEKIQVSLDSETRNRALDLIPKDALILVMGFSGAERRMSQLLEDVALRGKAKSRSILWMHWLEQPDYPLQRLIESIGKGDIRVAPRRYNSVDGFLLRILCSLKAEYPLDQVDLPRPADPLRRLPAGTEKGGPEGQQGPGGRRRGGGESSGSRRLRSPRADSAILRPEAPEWSRARGPGDLRPDPRHGPVRVRA